MKIEKKTQTLLEVSLLFTVVITLLVGIQTYVKRGLAARHKASTDLAVELVSKAAGRASTLAQYVPYYLDESSTLTSSQTFIEQAKGEAGELSQDTSSSESRGFSSKQEIDWSADDIWE